MQTAYQVKTCPVCEHWNNIIANPEMTEIKKSEAKVALANHQYFRHFKINNDNQWSK